MRIITDMTADDIRDLASRFREIVATYELIATTMDSRKIDSIPVPGLPTLEVTIDRILGSVGSTHRALLKQKPPRSAEAKAEESRLDRLEARNEAAQAKDRAKTRKKKGE